MNRRLLAKRLVVIVGVIVGYAIAAEIGLLYLSQRQEGDRLSADLAEQVASIQRLTSQNKELSAALAQTRGELEQLRDSDRIAFEQLKLGTDDFYAAQHRYEEFLLRFPKSSYVPAAKDALVQIQKRITESEHEEQAAISTAKKAQDADDALRVLEAFAADRPVVGAPLQEAIDKYRPDAARLRAGRRYEAELGIRVGEPLRDWQASGTALMPVIKVKVTNISGASIRSLRLVAQFFRSGTNETFGNEASAYVVSRSDTLPFEPGQSRDVHIMGNMGYKREFSWLAAEELSVKLFGISGESGAPPVLIRELSMEGPSRYGY
jgi:hypothetical protein